MGPVLVQAANTSLRRQLSEAQTKAGGAADLTAQVTQLQAALTSALDEADLLRSRSLAADDAAGEGAPAGSQEDTLRCLHAMAHHCLTTNTRKPSRLLLPLNVVLLEILDSDACSHLHLTLVCTEK